MEIGLEQSSAETTRISTTSLANFYLASYAFHSLQIEERNGLYKESDTNNHWLKCKADLDPYLKQVLEREMGNVVYASVKALVYEVLVNQTSYRSDEESFRKLMAGEFKPIEDEYQSQPERTEHLVNNRNVPASLIWKIQKLEKRVGQSYCSGNAEDLKKAVGELSGICALLLDEDGNWKSLTVPMGKYALSSNLNEEVTWVETMINASHKNGLILDWIAESPEQAKKLLDAKKGSDDRAIAKAADPFLLGKIKKYSKFIPMQRFS